MDRILADALANPQRQFNAQKARHRSGFIPLPLPLLRDHGQVAQTIGSLLSVFRQDGQTTFRSQSALAQVAGVSDRTLRDHLAVLVAAGVVALEDRPGVSTKVVRLVRPEAELLGAGFLPLPRYALELHWRLRAVYAYVVYRCEVSPSGDSCQDSLVTIASQVGSTRKTAGVAVAELERLGWIRREERSPGDAATMVLVAPPTPKTDSTEERIDPPAAAPGGWVNASEPTTGGWVNASDPHGYSLPTPMGKRFRAPLYEQQSIEKRPDKKDRLVLELSTVEAEAVAVKIAGLRGRGFDAVRSLGLDAAAVVAVWLAAHRREVPGRLADFAEELALRMHSQPKRNPIGWALHELRQYDLAAAAAVERLLPLVKSGLEKILEDAQRRRESVACGRCGVRHQPGRLDLDGKPACSELCLIAVNAKIEAARTAEPLTDAEAAVLSAVASPKLVADLVRSLGQPKTVAPDASGRTKTSSVDTSVAGRPDALKRKPERPAAIKPVPSADDVEERRQMLARQFDELLRRPPS